MSGIDAYNLQAGKTYRFSVRHNIMEDVDDKQPHYYEGKYVGPGSKKSIWVFSNFTDQSTKEMKPRKEIKFLGLLNPTFELVGGKNKRRKTYKKNHKKRNARKTRRNMHK